MSDPYPEVFSAIEWKRHTERAEADAKKFLARAERWEQLARQLGVALKEIDRLLRTDYPATRKLTATNAHVAAIADMARVAAAAYREAVDEEGT
jgi:hypothetical protein